MLRFFSLFASLVICCTDGHAFQCGSDLSTFIKPSSTIFIGRAISIEPIHMPAEGLLVSFEVHHHWQGIYSSSDDPNSGVGILVKRLQDEDISGGPNSFLPFQPKLGEHYLVIADPPSAISEKYPSISFICHGTRSIAELYNSQDLEGVLDFLGSPKQIVNQASLPCKDYRPEESFKDAMDVFEGTLIYHDVYETTQHYDIVRHSFIIHKSWKSSAEIPVGIQDIYTFRGDDLCGVLPHEQGCGKSFVENERYLVYTPKHTALYRLLNVEKELPIVTKCSHVAEGEGIVLEEYKNLGTPEYEFIYHKTETPLMRTQPVDIRH